MLFRPANRDYRDNNTQYKTMPDTHCGHIRMARPSNAVFKTTPVPATKTD